LKRIHLKERERERERERRKEKTNNGCINYYQGHTRRRNGREKKAGSNEWNPNWEFHGRRR
jgi:hypothetical protein